MGDRYGRTESSWAVSWAEIASLVGARELDRTEPTDVELYYAAEFGLSDGISGGRPASG